MKKVILMTCQYKNAKLIASGKKLIDIRKKSIDIDDKIDVYLYCGKNNNESFLYNNEMNDIIINNHDGGFNGKIFGKFTIDKYNICKFKLLNNGVKFFGIDSNCYSLLSLVRNSCESINNIEKYLGKNKSGYFWSFNNFTKFNNPINLSDFYIIKNNKYIPVNIPPQSFIYAYIDEEKNYL